MKLKNKSWFLGMLLGTSGFSMSGNMLTGKGTLRAAKGVVRGGKGYNNMNHWYRHFQFCSIL